MHTHLTIKKVEGSGFSVTELKSYKVTKLQSYNTINMHCHIIAHICGYGDFLSCATPGGEIWHYGNLHDTRDYLWSG